MMTLLNFWTNSELEGSFEEWKLISGDIVLSMSLDAMLNDLCNKVF
ncbi:unnamed protein product [Urochloa humidicola]